MKRLTITALAIAAFSAACLLSHSCANTTTAPQGGPKDTLPPIIREIVPQNGTTGFPTTGGTLTLTFDEYTVVKNSGEILLSPPVKKKLKTKVRGKSIVVTLQDTLRENTTYTIDFGSALADNNEGNIAPRTVYTFSTGDVIDSMYVTGRVIDCQTLTPVPKTLVALYRDHADSACFNALPDAAAYTDEWGFFTLRNIAPEAFRVYAYSDADGDFKYNPDGDKVAFLDSLFTPSAVVRDSIYELRGFDMKDTAACTARVPMLELNLFTGLQSVQYLQNSGRTAEKMGFLKFSAGDVVINSMTFVGIDSTDYLVQYNPARDSLDFWITYRYHLEDSLILRLNYMKTDSTGALVTTDESVVLGMPTDTALIRKNKEREKDTLFVLKVTSTPETVEQDGILLESEFPILSMVTDSISLTETNPKNQTEVRAIHLERDTTDIRRFILRPEGKLQPGYTYTVSIPRGTFTNLFGLPSREETLRISLPTGEELSMLTIPLTGVDSRYIVELTTEKLDRVHRRFVVEKDSVLVCPYLKADKYVIRILEDRNRNGIYDMGNLLEHRQPERVLIFESEPGKRVLEIPERSEVEQPIDIQTLFKK
jgi:hypothetical protein